MGINSRVDYQLELELELQLESEMGSQLESEMESQLEMESELQLKMGSPLPLPLPLPSPSPSPPQIENGDGDGNGNLLLNKAVKDSTVSGGVPEKVLAICPGILVNGDDFFRGKIKMTGGMYRRQSVPQH